MSREMTITHTSASTTLVADADVLEGLRSCLVDTGSRASGILAPSLSSQSSSRGVSVGTKTRTDQSCSKMFFETKIEGERLCCPIDFPMSSGCSSGFDDTTLVLGIFEFCGVSGCLSNMLAGSDRAIVTTTDYRDDVSLRLTWRAVGCLLVTRDLTPRTTADVAVSGADNQININQKMG